VLSGSIPPLINATYELRYHIAQLRYKTKLGKKGKKTP